MNLFFFAPPGSLAPTLLAAWFGMMIGSFLNVVIHRFPVMWQREADNFIAQETGQEIPHTTEYNLWTPRSACPHCGHKITALENIPLFSYLFLRGKCIECKTPISLRYPAIEVMTGLISAWLIWHFGSGPIGLAALPFTYLLISMSFIDAQTKQLPDDLTYPLLWIGLLVNINQVFCPLQDAVIAAVAGYSALWLVNSLFQALLKKQGMGNGDFKLLAALGAWFGWMMLPQIILIASVGGLLAAGIGAVFGKKAQEGRIPFGPFLAIAGMATLVYGTEIAWYVDALLNQISGLLERLLFK